MRQIKNSKMPLPLQQNPSYKRRFFYTCASLYKCLYLDLEFPYFLEYKKKKFNWKGFMYEFGSADLNVYIELTNAT